MACVWNVAEAVLAGIGQAGLELVPARYSWPLGPAVVADAPDCLREQLGEAGLEGVAEGSYRQTRRLREALRQCWQNTANDRERFRLTWWFVKRWGGVTRISSCRLRKYARAKDEELAGRSSFGVSSWSKALALRDPGRFAIYDARVALALNAAQLLAGLGRGGVRFPSMHVSRSPEVRALAREVSAKVKRKGWSSCREFYRFYIGVLRELKRHEGLDLLDAEMTLFAHAIALGKAAAGPRAL